MKRMTNGRLTDAVTPLETLRAAYRKFSQERNWGKYHDVKNVSASIVLEAAELVEIFQWDNSEESQKKLKDPETLLKVRHELADILAYVINFAEQAEIDLTEAFFEKLEHTKKKYPVSLVNKDLSDYHKIKADYRKQRK